MYKLFVLDRNNCNLIIVQRNDYYNQIRKCDFKKPK